MQALKITLATLGWACLASTGMGADVAFFGMAKGQQFVQPWNGAPTLLASNAFTFQAFVQASTNGVVTNATVKPSTSALVRQLAGDAPATLWRFEDYTNSQAQLDAAYPAGSGFSPTTYTFTMSTVNDGTRTVALNFWLLPPLLAISYPPTPRVNNLAAAQAIDTTRDFTLGWDSLGGGALTIVQLLVVDGVSNVVFASPAPFQPGALTGASTSHVIPAGVLPPGASLTGHLTAANPGLPNTNSYVGALGIATLAKDTAFALVTRPAPVPPALELLTVTPGQVRLLAIGLETNRLYHLQRATNFTAWPDIATTNPVSTAALFEDVPAPGQAGVFYRLRIGQ